MIKEMAFVCYPVTNFDKSREFYEKTLGLKLTTLFGGKKEDKYGFAEYDLGNATLSIGFGSETMVPSKNGASVALEVDNFQVTIKDLKNKKVKFTMEPMETPVCHMAIISDPDGSQIMIHKRK